MRTTHRGFRLVAIAVAAIAVVAACSSGATTSTPKGVVEEALRLVADKDFDGLAELACAEQRDTIKQDFDLAGGLAGSLPVDVDADKLVEAIDIDVSDVTVTETNVSGDTATVTMAGTMGMTIDEEVFKAVVREVAEQQGTPVDDATLDSLLAMMGSFTQSIPMNTTVDLVQENGAWKICD